MRQRNVLTIDVEDYFQVENFKKVINFSDWGKYENRVVKNTEQILKILEDAGVKATFFVLGWTAEKFPDLVRCVHKEGHEVASHGYAHCPIFTQTPELFRQDLVKSKKILEEIIKEPILGYRAPTFSLTERSLWALDILIEEGFRYDSSVLPARHKDRGLPGAERYPHKIGDNGLLWEIPISTVKVFNRNLSFSGGGYFRLYPYGVIRYYIRKINRENQPVVVYLHPWEIDPDQPRIKAPGMSRFKHYVNLSRMETKLKKLLNDFAFGSVNEIFRDELGLK